jgi:hypothetical protein
MKKFLLTITTLAMLSNLAVASQLDPTVTTWQYGQEADPMGRGTKHQASLVSLNMVELNFPYQGAQPGVLAIRREPKSGTDVILIIEHGQFAGTYSCNHVTVRFDDGALQKFRIVEESTGKHNMVFIDDEQGFIRQMTRSSRVLIEAMFYAEGTRVFEFNVEGLNAEWAKVATREVKSDYERGMEIVNEARTRALKAKAEADARFARQKRADH